MAFANNRKDGRQSVFLGPTGSVATFDEASLVYPGQLGSVVQDGAVYYQLVGPLNDAGVAADATLFWNSDDPRDFAVSNADQTFGTAGIAAGAITLNQYGFSKFYSYDSARIADPT